MNLADAVRLIGAKVVYTSPADPTHKQDGYIDSVSPGGNGMVNVRYGQFTVTPTHPDNLTLVPRRSND